MLRGHKVRVYPNNEQETYLKKGCGTARFTYNWALDKWIGEHSGMPEMIALKEAKAADYNPDRKKTKKQAKKDRKAAIKKAEGDLREALRANGERLDEGGYRKELNGIKGEKFPWMYDVTKCAAQLAIKNDFASAVKHYLGKEKFGFPQFKKKGQNDSFRMDYTALSGIGAISGGCQYLKIPNLEAPLKMAEALRVKGKIMAVVISRKADQWYASFTVETDISEILKTYRFPDSKNQAVGVDLGIKDLATLSDGKVIGGSKATRQYADKLTRAQKSLSRKAGSNKGEEKSNNYLKQQVKVARIHKQITDARHDALHKLTTFLAVNYSVIGIEDLNIKGMLANHKLAKHIADGAFYEFKRQLLYKAEVTGAKVVLAGPFYPSSKLCSSCGAVNEGLKLSEREWGCQCCGAHHNRDLNAAINLEKMALAAIA